MPQPVRDFWLPRFRNFKVKFIFSANKMEGSEIRTHANSCIRKKKKKSTSPRVEGELTKCLILRSFEAGFALIF